MRWLLIISAFVLPAEVFAQDEVVDPYAECGEVLNPEFSAELVTTSKEGTYWYTGQALDSALVGKKCSVEKITIYMQSSGWIIRERGEIIYEFPFSNSQFTADQLLRFCLPNTGLWRLFEKCGGTAGFYIFEGNVTRVSFTAAIRLGG